MGDEEPLRIYTDGACSGNPGPGGWAWASSPEHTASGGDEATTNNRMELMAVLRAIEDNPDRPPRASSWTRPYVKDGLEKWSRNWVRNDWRTKDKKPVKNQEIWKPLIEARDARDDLTFEWVKGHSGDAMNDLVDELAVEQRDRYRTAAGGRRPRRRAAASSSDLPPEEQRAERRKRDGRIPEGHLLLVAGHSPPELGGWDPNPTADDVRRRLVDLIDGYARITDDLVVVTGLRPGAEQLAAEAAIRADVPYVAVLPFADPDRSLAPDTRARFRDLVGPGPRGRPAREEVAVEQGRVRQGDAPPRRLARRRRRSGRAGVGPDRQPARPALQRSRPPAGCRADRARA